MIFPWYPKALGPWQMAALCTPALLLFRRDLCGMFLVDIAPATPGLPVDGGLPRSKNAVLRNDINRLWINYERNKYSNAKHRGLTNEKEDLTKMHEFWATDNWSVWCVWSRKYSTGMFVDVGPGQTWSIAPKVPVFFLCETKQSQFGSQSFWPSPTCLPGNDQSQFLRWSFGQAHGASHPRVFLVFFWFWGTGRPSQKSSWADLVNLASAISAARATLHAEVSESDARRDSIVSERYWATWLADAASSWSWFSPQAKKHQDCRIDPFSKKKRKNAVFKVSTTLVVAPQHPTGPCLL